ncbi:MAG: VPLPA-CTERM sorting domain-containing protein [Pseudomonadota bacterium]
MKTFIAAALSALFLGSAATAATVSYTEGKRHTVEGSTHITNPDVPSTAPGFITADLNSGDTIDIHGRIVTAVDVYTFTANSAFRIDWIFDGYALEDDNPFDDKVRGDDNTISGFVARPATANGSVTAIYLNNVASTGNDFSTNIISGDSTIFGVQSAGTYTLKIDGLNQYDALYDTRISTMPVPAGAVLLLTGLGALAAVRRRRRT